MLARRSFPSCVTTRDIVHRTGVTTITVNNWRSGSPERKPLPFQKLGRRVVFLEHEVQAWLQEHRPDLLCMWQRTEPNDDAT